MNTQRQHLSASDNSGACAAGSERLVRFCAGLRSHEKVYILANPATQDVARYVYQAALEVTEDCLLEMVPEADMHGASSPASVAEAMFNADVIFCLTRMSMAHSEARKAATDNGARYLSLPDYSLDQLASPALLFDFSSIGQTVTALADTLDGGEVIQLTTGLGSKLVLNVKGRIANRCPGLVHESGSLGSPPDAEVNIAPLETCSEGVLVIDGSIPCKEVGLLNAPVTLKIECGRITDIESDDPAAVKALNSMFEKAGPNSRVLAEFGIGLNPDAQLCGRMLEDEGCAGTVHFGFGSNITIGGLNEVPFHLDFVMRSPEVRVDGKNLSIPVPG